MKIKKTVITDTAKSRFANAVSNLTGNIQNYSSMTEAKQVETKVYTITVLFNNFNAHSSTIRIAIDYGDDHTQITENTYAFDNAAIAYFGRLSLSQVRLAAYHEKRAQDKTTVRRSEFTFHSDGLLLSETVQPDNVLAVATTPAPECTVREDYLNDQIFRQDTRYRNFDVTDQTLDRLYLAPTPAGGVNHLLDHHYKFDSISAVTRCSDGLKNFAENITYDHLDRMTDATLAGASTVAARCDDLGTITSRTKNPGLSDPGGRRFFQRHQSRIPQPFFLNFFEKKRLITSRSLV